MGLLRAYLRAVKRGEAATVATLAGLLVFASLLLFAALLAGNRLVWHEAVGQEKKGTRAEPLPAITVPEISLPEPSEEASVAEPPPAAIPGLASLDVVAYLRYSPVASDFTCNRGLSKETCTSSEDGATYEVAVVEENPLRVLSVTATAYDASDEEAAEFLAYVANLSLEDTDPINAEVWVKGNVSSGGQYRAKGAQLKLYGTEGARTLEVVGTGQGADEARRNGRRTPKADRGGKEGAKGKDTGSEKNGTGP